MSYKAYNNRTFGSFFVSNTCNKIDNVTSVALYKAHKNWTLIRI